MRDDATQCGADRSRAAAAPQSPRSGQQALSDAEVRAATTRDVNLESLPPLPIAADTANVRLGPELDDRLLAVLPLIGVWRGSGRFGNEPGERAPQFGQQLTFSHDGRSLVRYESITWLLDDSGAATQPAERELGWLQPSHGSGTLAFQIVRSTGEIDVFSGTAPSLTHWQFAGARGSRLYGITPDGSLAYVDERVSECGEEAAPHSSAVLGRIAG